MSDLGGVVLTRALSFGLQRLRRVVALEPAALVAMVAPGANPAPVVADVRAALATVRRHADDLEAALSVPLDTAERVQRAVDALAGALAAASGACQAIAGVGAATQALGRLVTSVLREAGATAGGLLGQLGLDQPPGDVTAAGTVLSYRLRREDRKELGGGVAVSHAVLEVRLDWGAKRLTLVLAADAEVGLAADDLLAVIAADAAVTTRVTVTADSTGGVTLGHGRPREHAAATVTRPGLDVRDLTLEVPRGLAAVEVSARLLGTLGGGIRAVVDGVGVRLVVDPAAAPPLRPAPVAPTGLAIALDARLVRGGGQLQQRAGGYGGTLEVSVGPVAAEAIALLDTDPFSLALLVFAEFRPAIQLSFGFTLEGVGGLVAVDRAVSSDALMAGLHDGTADTLLFPKDPERVNRSLLEKIFPARPGAVAVGPAFKLGWGTPISLLTAKVGIVAVAPDPKLLLLGAVRIAVPNPKLAIVELNAMVHGELAPDHLLVLVSLVRSRLAGYPLSGDLGLFVGYGGRPDFALSAGGFHPGYAPPAALAGLHRLAIDLSPPAVLTLRAEAYLALTASAFMLGARVEAGIDFVVASAHGHLSFDALVLFDPFHFTVDLLAAVVVEVIGRTVFGVTLSLHLEGPGRWMAHGTATIDLFFLPDIHLEVGPLTWGDLRVEEVVVVSPLRLVLEQLRAPASWLPRLPADGERLVTFDDDAAPDGGVFAHPLGGFEVRQKAVPLDTKLEHLGGYLVSEHHISLGTPTLDGAEARDVSATEDLFAPGQFQRLSDDAKLSQPAFGFFRSGLAMSGRQASFGGQRDADYRWETVYPHRPLPAASAEPFTFPDTLVAGVLAAGQLGRRRGGDPRGPWRVAGAPLRVAAEPRP